MMFYISRIAICKTAFCSWMYLKRRGVRTMRRRVSALVLALCTAFTIHAAAYAITPYADSTTKCDPLLCVSGNTASCRLVVEAEDDSASITATITLLKSDGEGGFTVLKRWGGLSGAGTLRFGDSYTSSRITSGATYRMEYAVRVDGTNGIDNISDYVEGNQ